MPSELEPVAASNSELKSMALEDVEDDDPSKDDRLDEDKPTELIAETPYCVNKTVTGRAPVTVGK